MATAATMSLPVYVKFNDEFHEIGTVELDIEATREGGEVTLAVSNPVDAFKNVEMNNG